MDRSNPYDLLVVGCGGAGMAAAVSYAETAQALGREPKVAVIERSTEAERGGATRWTDASMLVDEEFVLDGAFVAKMAELSKGLADAEFCEAFVREVPETGKFLKGHGIEFSGVIQEFEGVHQASTSPVGGGLSIINHLGDALAEHPGAAIFYETEAVRFSLSDAGRIDGVVVRGPDGLLQTIYANAVVLACGGFEGNDEMLTQYAGKNTVDLRKLAPGIAYNKGDGIRMARDIGADTAGQFDRLQILLVDKRTERPDSVLYGHSWPIVVNGEAKRFWDEGAKRFGDSFELLAYEVWENQDQTAFFITDQTIMGDDRLTGVFKTDVPPEQAGSIRELATKLGLDPDVLAETVETYNAGCDDTPFDPKRYDGKATVGVEPPKSNWANPINNPPYYAYPAALAICFTFGGVKTDGAARVLSTGGAPIPGLYAAGEIMGVYYHKYVGATSVLKACTFGRVAGAHAAHAAAEG